MVKRKRESVSKPLNLPAVMVDKPSHLETELGGEILDGDVDKGLMASTPVT